MTDITRPTRPDLSCDEVRDLAASFVLGALDAAEADAVRAHLATCADPHAEIAELGSACCPRSPRACPMVEPPAALKGRIMAAAAADLEARGRGRRRRAPPPRRGRAGQPTTLPAAPTPFPAAAERQQRAADPSRHGFLGAAASRRSSRSCCSAAGTSSSRASSDQREPTSRTWRRCSTSPASPGR